MEASRPKLPLSDLTAKLLALRVCTRIQELGIKSLLSFTPEPLAKVKSLIPRALLSQDRCLILDTLLETTDTAWRHPNGRGYILQDQNQLCFVHIRPVETDRPDSDIAPYDIQGSPSISQFGCVHQTDLSFLLLQCVLFFRFPVLVRCKRNSNVESVVSYGVERA